MPDHRHSSGGHPDIDGRMKKRIEAAISIKPAEPRSLSLGHQDNAHKKTDATALSGRKIQGTHSSPTVQRWKSCFVPAQSCISFAFPAKTLSKSSARSNGNERLVYIVSCSFQIEILPQQYIYPVSLMWFQNMVHAVIN